MANPILDAMENRSSSLGQQNNILNIIKSSKNPEETVKYLLKQNPNVQNMLNMYKSPKEAFYAIAKQRGVDPYRILSMLK